MKKPAFCLLAVILVVSANAQTRKRPPSRSQSTAPSRPRKLVETVKATDGREIRLYDDMTYEVSSAVALPTSTTFTLTIKAGLITNAGDVKAVARRDFIVFKEDIKQTLSAVNDRGGKPLDIFRFWLADQFRELDEGRSYIAAVDKLKPIIVGTFTTDFGGNASVQLPSSELAYWIYGSSQMVGPSSCMWYLEFKPHKNGTLVLDNNNAAYCG